MLETIQKNKFPNNQKLKKARIIHDQNDQKWQVGIYKNKVHFQYLGIAYFSDEKLFKEDDDTSKGVINTDCFKCLERPASKTYPKIIQLIENDWTDNIWEILGNMLHAPAMATIDNY